MVKALVEGLRELPSVWIGSKALRTIILDLDPPLFQHGVSMVLDTELRGTPAGETLADMRAHDEEVSQRRERHQAYVSPEAAKERKRVKKENKALEHARRQSETRQKNAERLEVLRALASLSPSERLARFATAPALMLDSISSELIPMQENDLIGLDNATVAALLTRIGGRRGAWGRLRSMLEYFIKDKSEQSDET